MHDRAADGAAQLVTLINGFERGAGLGVDAARVARALFVVAQVVEKLSVKIVRTGLGYGVHDTAGGTTILGRIV